MHNLAGACEPDGMDEGALKPRRVLPTFKLTVAREPATVRAHQCLHPGIRLIRRYTGDIVGRSTR